MAGYANKDGVEVSGNTIQFSADPGSPIAAIVGKVGVEAAEKALQKDIGAITNSAVVIIPPDNDTAIEDQETPMREDGEELRDEVVVGAMVLVNGEWYAVDAVDHEVSTVVYASNKDGQEFEFTLDDIEHVDTSSVEIFTDPPTENAEETVTESYTSSYMSDQPVEVRLEPVTESVSFKERFKPKTIDQLAELRRYGL